jgi:DNA-binding LacI/PurR family transcriptional regulator
MKHITIADIAREAGVSKTTVSRVLSKPYLVNEKTKEKIRSVIEKNSFTPNALAQGLAGMPTKNIGVVVDEFPNNFYIDLADGIDSVISENNYFLQVMSSHWIPERELQGIRSMLINQVDGILIAPVALDSPAVELLKKSGVPFVLMSCKSDDPDMSYVCCDNYKGGAIMAEHINSLGHEQIIIVSVFDHQSVRDRIEGFMDHLHTDAARIAQYSNAKTYKDGYDLAPIIVESGSIRTKKTSLFVVNDYVAIGVMARLLEMGIDIPEQVAVAGFDDIRISAMCKIPLTTISQSVYDMGRLAATSLMNLITKKGSPPFKHIIEPRLVVRNSTCLGKPPAEDPPRV